ncbi:MAG TPA: helicase C-terminal domain-containing protein [Limnochordales bacterium]
MAAHPDGIGALFDEQGPLAAALGARWERRLPQEWMARQVARALEAGAVAIIEAGTGTGKSLAYLLPLASRLLDDGPEARAVVATYTIHLQEQLTARDLPVVQRTLGRPLTYAVAKGWGNYLCRLRLERLRQGQAFWLEEPEVDTPSAEVVERLDRWADTTDDGSLSSAPAGVGSEVWSLVAAHPDRCSRRHCPFYETCFYFAARQRMLQAQLIVANHHLLLSDLVVRREAGAADAAVLPSFRYLVVDEAHHLDDVATAHLGMELRRSTLLGRLQRIARGRGSRALSQAATEALEVVRRVFDGLGQAALAAPDDRRVLEGAVPRTVRLRPGESSRWVPASLLDAATESLEQLAGTAHRLAETLDAGEADDSTPVDDRVVELRALARWALHMGEALRAWAEAQDDDTVYWLEAGPSSELTLRAAPLDVGPVLAGELLGQVRSAVLTSATLACDGRMDAVRRRWGLAEPQVPGDLPVGGRHEPPEPESELLVEQEEDGVWRVVVGDAGAPSVVREEGRVLECVIPSPFDFRRQALLAVPVDMPDVDAASFPERLALLVADVSKELGGRTFCLFTSYRALAETRERLAPHLEPHGIRLLCQGDMPRTGLLDTFREAEGAGWVLLGTDSFWEGVDVPGAALSCVIMARLPFPIPDHPVALARAERLRRLGLSPFREDALPRAVVKFRQGFGRLVRSQQDRGAVVVADRRLLTRPYRTSFLGALPRCQLLAAPAERIVREVGAWVAMPSRWS